MISYDDPCALRRYQRFDVNLISVVRSDVLESVFPIPVGLLTHRSGSEFQDPESVQPFGGIDTISSMDIVMAQYFV